MLVPPFIFYIKTFFNQRTTKELSSSKKLKILTKSPFLGLTNRKKRET